MSLFSSRTFSEIMYLIMYSPEICFIFRWLFLHSFSRSLNFSLMFLTSLVFFPYVLGHSDYQTWGIPQSSGRLVKTHRLLGPTPSFWLSLDWNSEIFMLKGFPVILIQLVGYHILRPTVLRYFFYFFAFFKFENYSLISKNIFIVFYFLFFGDFFFFLCL